MATPSPLDPTALWRDLVSQWEKGINEVANRAMTSEEFNRGMHGGLGVSLTAQKALGDALGRYLTALNLPTRNEITALGDRLQSIEERLIRIAAMLDQAASAGAPSAVASAPSALLPMPRRTKRPPAKAPPQEATERSPKGLGTERATGPQPAAEPPAEPTPATGTRARTTGSTPTAVKRAPTGSAGGRRAEPPPAASRQPPSRRKSRAAS